MILYEEDIYPLFLDKITDYKLPKLSVQNRDATLLRLLQHAFGKFNRISKVDLSNRDDLLLEFYGDLSYEEIDILTEYMTLRWWEPYKNNSDLMEDNLTSKDFHALHSPANLLGEVRKTYQDCKDECRRLVNEYSIVNGNISKLRPKGG